MLEGLLPSLNQHVDVRGERERTIVGHQLMALNEDSEERLNLETQRLRGLQSKISILNNQ